MQAFLNRVRMDFYGRFAYRYFISWISPYQLVTLRSAQSMGLSSFREGIDFCWMSYAFDDPAQEIRLAHFWNLTSFMGCLDMYVWRHRMRSYLHDFQPFHLASMNTFLHARRPENKESYVDLKRGNKLWSLDRIIWKWISKKTVNDSIEYNSKLTLKK